MGLYGECGVGEGGGGVVDLSTATVPLSINTIFPYTAHFYACEQLT